VRWTERLLWLSGDPRNLLGDLGKSRRWARWGLASEALVSGSLHSPVQAIAGRLTSRNLGCSERWWGLRVGQAQGLFVHG